MIFFNYVRRIPITTTVSAPPFFVPAINAVFNVSKLFVYVYKKTKLGVKT